MTTIQGNGASQAIYLQMNGPSAMQYSVGTTPGSPSWINITSWPVTIENTNAGSSTILNVVVTQALTISGSTGGVNGYFTPSTNYVTFDGANYTIAINVTTYPGFILNGLSGANGQANIVVKNIRTSSASGTLAADAGWICQSYFGRGVSGCSIQGCINSGAIAANAGGICGSYVGSDGGSVTFTSCTNNGAILRYASGIAGPKAGRAGSVTFTTCANNVTIGAVQTETTTGGGIAGAEAGSVGGSATFTGCTNIGFIQLDAGGIAGSDAAITGGLATFTGCMNSGSVLGGGIAGPGAARGSGSRATFTDCSNTGIVSTLGGGGIVGQDSGGQLGSLTFTNCTNSGNILGIESGGIAGRSVGRDQSSITFTNCRNTGNQDPLTNRSGGIIGARCGGTNFGSGYAPSTLTITNCSNTGEIFTGGGICGNFLESNATFTNCTNSGNISGTGANGTGIGGLVGPQSGNSSFSTINFTNCSNSGIVGGTNGECGGIVGSQCTGMVLVNCSNSGRITAPSAGGIVGRLGSNIRLTNCFCTGELAGNDQGGIVGPSFGNNATANGAAAITGCYSTNTIGDYSAGCGGIAASNCGSDPYTILISNCYSLGDVSGGSNTSAGIVKSCISGNKVTISNCYSYGGNSGNGIVPTDNIQPLSRPNCYVANKNWSVTSANALLLGFPTSPTNPGATWTMISTSDPYILTAFTYTSPIYNPVSVSVNNTFYRSAPGLFSGGYTYRIVGTSQVANVATTSVLVYFGTAPYYSAYNINTFTLTNTNGGSGRQITASINETTGVLDYTLPYPCFLEGTQILCFENNQEVYRRVESLRKGDLVKTIHNGYLPIHMIGTSPIYNPNNDHRISNRLYKCSKENYPGLFEDLYITGCHSILVPWLSYEQEQNTIASLGRLFVTDRHCRLMAWLDEKADPYTREGIYNIYHIALENNDYYMNYGIYANGLLVESCSKRYLTELSNMRILGEEDSSLTEGVSAEENVFHKMPEMVETC